MRKKMNCGKRFLAITYSLAQGCATGLGAFDNAYVYGFIAGGGFGILASVFRTITAYSFQGNVILKTDSDELKNQNEDLYQILSPDEIEPREEQPHTCCSITNTAIFASIDGSLNFSDHAFIWRQLFQLLNIDKRGFWPIFITSFLIQQLYYMCHEGYEAVEKIGQRKPFYINFFSCLSKNNKKSRKLFRKIGSLHHAIFELAPWFVSFPQIIQLMCAYPFEAGIPLGVFFALLTILVNDQTNLFEGQHAEQHLAGETRYIEPATIPSWRNKIVRKTIFFMAPFHGAIAATPTYVVLSQKVSPVAGISAGLFTFFITTIGTYESEVKEAQEQLDKTARMEAMRLACPSLI